MRKILSFLLFLLVIMSLFGCSENSDISVAEEPTLEYLIFDKVDDGYSVRIAPTALFLSAKVVVPEEYMGEPVVAIDETDYNYEFKDKYVVEISLPSTIKTIGPSAFSRFVNLKTVKISSSSSLVKIGGSAFENCKALTSITIPDSVPSIGDYAFQGCESLASVTIGNNATSNGYETSIGAFAFCRCESLTSVTIGNGVTSIGYNAFYGCKHITYVEIPRSVVSIESLAFYDSEELESVRIPYECNVAENAFLKKTTIIRY